MARFEDERGFLDRQLNETQVPIPHGSDVPGLSV